MAELISRRGLFGRGAALGAVFLAACAGKSETTAASGDELAIATWPLYIDIDDDKKRPTVDQFERETGTKVRYREVIEDSDSFLGTIRPALAAGKPTGWDVVVISDATVTRMVRLGYVEPLDHTRLPNVTANEGLFAKASNWDPGNAHSVPWQGGLTGIAYNPKLTGREITSFKDLLDPAFKGKVGMLSEMTDTMSLALMGLGVKPEAATDADARRAPTY